jgi:AcrR family transcriptional regulator
LSCKAKTRSKAGAGRAAKPRRRIPASERRDLIEAAAAELFAERGYYATSIDEIARRSGITPPVLYDHFESKQDLYRRLLERHFAELRQVWREHLPGEDPTEQRVGHAIDAWFAYVQTHPFAARLLFRDTTGDPTIATMHEAVAAESRAEILPMLAAGGDADDGVVGRLSGENLEMAWVVMRGVLQGLAIWWNDHPDVSRERLVATAMSSLWVGLERLSEGEGWRPDSAR